MPERHNVIPSEISIEDFYLDFSPCDNNWTNYLVSKIYLCNYCGYISSYKKPEIEKKAKITTILNHLQPYRDNTDHRIIANYTAAKLHDIYDDYKIAMKYYMFSLWASERYQINKNLYTNIITDMFNLQTKIKGNSLAVTSLIDHANRCQYLNFHPIWNHSFHYTGKHLRKILSYLNARDKIDDNHRCSFRSSGCFKSSEIDDIFYIIRKYISI
jgi:hypothetical protein